MSLRKKTLVLCADDFGMNEPINKGVLTLAATGRLSATSCLTQGKAWSKGAQQLRTLDIDVGLHINFTEQLDAKTHVQQPLPRLIASAWLRQLEPKKLVRAIEHQCELFEQHMQRVPDFFDGHQHVHQFPQIRDALLDVLARRYACDDFWVRSTAIQDDSLAQKRGWKARLIALLGSRALRHRLRQQDLPHNDDFAGVYDLAGGTARFEQWMQVWLSEVPAQMVVMCHPADGVDAADTIGAQRAAEFAYLNSHAFGQLLVDQGIRLARYPL